MLVDLQSRPLDRVLLGVEQVLHEQDQLDLLPLVDAVARTVLGRVQELELALPVAQDVWLQLRELTDLADGEELLDRLRGAHASTSGRSPRAISSGTALRAGRPSKRMRYTIVAIGISTPSRCASASALFVVATPSATVCFPASASSSVFPCPTSRPTARFRLSAPVHVSTRSPMPARPANVDARAPMATPSRVISARPRVMSAARELLPRPTPSRIPVATAITFLSDPPSSTPIRSSCV